jgi:tetratricopeptide (TPR) repeat protein
MDWKRQLRVFELNKQWDQAIEFMQIVIAAHPDDMDAYIYMNFLIMNLLVEEDYDVLKHDYYAELAQKYFDESYAKFSNNAEYLFCTGITAVMSEWYFGIEVEDYQRMLTRAMELEPDNIVYKETYYLKLDQNIPKEHEELLAYAKLILQKNSSLIKEYETRGAIGEYLKDCQISWANRILNWQPLPQDPQSVWKRKLDSLERSKEWDQAIEFMQTTISTYPNNMQAYIYTNFLLMNLLVNEKFNEDKHDYYASLLKKYFDESYAKFSNNAEYLFCTGVTATMDEEYLGLETKDVNKMLIRVMELEPNNILYKSADYLYVNRRILNQSPAALDYAEQVLERGSKLRDQLNWHCAFNKYLSESIIKWAEDVVAWNSKTQQVQA